MTLPTPDIAGAKAALAHLDMDVNPVSVRAKSRDFFWYSPVLKSRLDHVTADFVVAPKSEAEVIEVLRVCYAHNVPVTTRGTGTGNYGQAMPLAGGCILHLHNMNKVKEIHPGRVIVEPGCVLKDLDAACKADSRQEIRMFSSTWATAGVCAVRVTFWAVRVMAVVATANRGIRRFMVAARWSCGGSRVGDSPRLEARNSSRG